LNPRIWSGEHPGTEWLGAYQDRELDPAEARAVESHLERCPSCRELLEEITRVDQMAAALKDDLPDDPFWTGLESRIRARVQEETGETVGAGVAGMKVAAVEPGPALRRPTGWTRWFGTGPSLRWGLATAAGLVIVVLTSRLVVNQMAPDQTLRARSTPSAPPVGANDERRLQALAAPEGGTAGTGEAEPPAGVAGEAKSPVQAPREATERQVVEVVPPTRKSSKEAFLVPNTSLRKDAASPVEPGSPGPAQTGEGFASAPHDVLPPEQKQSADQPTLAPAPPTASRENGVVAQAAPVGNAELFSAAPEDSEGAAGTLTALRSGAQAGGGSVQNPPLAFAAEVDKELWKGEAAARNEVKAPEGLEEQIAASADRLLRRGARPRSEDYRIAYAAALRALESGRPELARKGFSIVALGIPESDLARDAEYNERIAQFRIREKQGEERSLILRDLGERADHAWDRAQEVRDRPTCRYALAYERARLTLLEEIQPRVDRAPFEDRVRILKACS
jgi:anti-sigma factor RsiW